MDNHKRQNELLNIYIRNMQRIKWRIYAAQEVRCRRKNTSNDLTDTEFCILQFRKVFELIALSSLISDADVYTEKLGNIEQMWNAELIFNHIERIHPNFFPIAVRTDPSDPIEKAKWLPPPEPCLTKEQLVKAYVKCDKYLHESSPFMSQKHIFNEYSAIWKDICNWEQLVKSLLSSHIVFLYNSNCLLHINMGGPDDDSPPVGWIMQKTDKDEQF